MLFFPINGIMLANKANFLAKIETERKKIVCRAQKFNVLNCNKPNMVTSLRLTFKNLLNR